MLPVVILPMHEARDPSHVWRLSYRRLKHASKI